MAYEQIKLLVLDCDGVLSDGQIVYDSNGAEAKSFSARDGLGIKLLAFADIKVAVVNGRKSEMLTRRCQDLGIEILHQKVRNKLSVVTEIIKDLGLSWENVAYMGDDWNDYPVLEKVALSSCPNNVTEDFKRRLDFVASHNGGDGAIRDLITFILKEKGIYEEIIDTFLDYLRK